MGLAERRGVERFKSEQYPDWVAKIGEAAGFDLPVEVVWEELAVPDYADSYPEFFVKVFFQPLVDALGANLGGGVQVRRPAWPSASFCQISSCPSPSRSVAGLWLKSRRTGPSRPAAPTSPGCRPAWPR